MFVFRAGQRSAVAFASRSSPSVALAWPSKSQLGVRQRFFSMSTPLSTFKFAGIQLLVGADKAENLERARKAVDEAAANGAKVVSLPECFNCPYSNDSFPSYSESVPDGVSAQMLAAAAKVNKIYLIGGSIPERDGEKLYNTSLTFGPDGALLAKHRKVHLFDINVPGRIKFMESETLSPGNSITVFDTEFCKMAVGICYDIRFPELAQLCRQEGTKFMVYPGAFNMTTGPVHWELLQRARALDNQMYVATVSPARNPAAGYQAWGHTTVVGPWGDVIATTEHDSAIVYADINVDRVDEVREQIPVSKQRRNDIYELRLVGAPKQ